MVELYDADGNLVEGALTEEEVNQKIEDAKKEAEEGLSKEVEALKEEHTKKEEELQEQIKETQEELEKVGKKDYNWQKLREKKDELESALKKEREETDKKIEEVKGEIRGNKVDGAIKKLTGESEELFDKVKFYYKRFEGEPKDEEDFKSRISDAFLLATGGKESSPLTSERIGTGIGQPPGAKGTKGKLTEGGKEVAEKMGISDDELKKEGLL